MTLMVSLVTGAVIGYVAGLLQVSKVWVPLYQKHLVRRLDPDTGICNCEVYPTGHHHMPDGTLDV